MSKPPGLARLLVRLFVRRDARDVILGDLDEEFRDEIAAGSPIATTRRRYWRQALGSILSFGRERLAPESAVEAGADPIARGTALRNLWHDARYGVRLLSRSPGFALTAIVTLAVGIGANTAIFAVAWQVILRPMPYPQPDQLVTVWEKSIQYGTRNSVMPANYRDWEREGSSFAAIAAYGYFQDAQDVSGNGDPEQWRIRHVTGRYFHVFGMRPLLGRTLTTADATQPTVVLSEGTWRRRFAADPGIVGREIRLADRATLVAGVMPLRFEEQAGRVDAWSAFELPPEKPGQRLAAHYLVVVARLKTGVTPERADAEVQGIAARAAQQFPLVNGKLSAMVIPIQDDRGQRIRSGLVMLSLSAAAVLLIACVNLGTLLTSRTAGRMQEFAIRASLGASRPRLVTQLVTESLVLAAIAALAGVALCRGLLVAFDAFYPGAGLPVSGTATDPAVLGFASAIAVLGALGFAVWPAWRASGRASGRLGRRADTGDRRARAVRASLVSVQIALAVVLVVGAATLGFSLRNVLGVDPGLATEGVLTFDASLRSARLETVAQGQQLLRRIVDEVRTVPGVSAACAINQSPFAPEPAGGMTYIPEGQESKDAPVNAAPRTVTAGCLELLRIRLLRGRTFTDHDVSRAAIVSESFARAAWPGEDALGRRVHVGVKDGDLIEVVGVVADTRHQSLAQRAYPVLYEVAVDGAAFPPSKVLARTAGPPESVFASIRAAVRRADPNQPVANLRTLDEMRSATVSGRRFDLSLVSMFTALALVLCAVGIYGLLAQTVAQRTREIGVRLALGASPVSVVGLVMRAALVAIALGAAIGLAGAYYSATLLEGLVYGISPKNPWLYGWVLAGVAVLALLAAWIPARRAARLDPLTTLRAD